MSTNSFDKDYFRESLCAGKFIKLSKAAKWAQYYFWKRYCNNNFLLGANILEVGCGMAFLCKQLQNRYSYYGIDISYYALNYSKIENKEFNLINASAGNLPFESNYFDAIVTFDVVEHLKDPRLFFSEANRVLRKDGLIIVSTPNTNSLGVKLKSNSISLIPCMY